jgi:hypothetical protein
MSNLDQIEEKLEAIEAELKETKEEPVAVVPAPEPIVTQEPTKNPSPIIQMAIDQAAERLIKETAK